MNTELKSLPDIADLCLGKMLDKRKNKGELRPYLANINVRWGEFDLSDLREMRFEEHEHARYGLRHADIVMCEGGEPGRCAIWQEEQPGLMIQKALHRIRTKPGINPFYLYYALNYLGRNGHFDQLFTGSTIKHLPGQNLAKVKIPIPELSDQTRIADILSAYDDLIENNRRRIQFLEESARLLYREWFVHLRFPGHETTRIVDGVPEGWKRTTIGEVCETVGGGTPSSKVPSYWNGELDWVVPSDVTKNEGLILLDTDRKITESGLQKSSAKMLPPMSILMTSRASVGFFALMDRAVCTNQGFISIIPQAENQRYYLLFNLLNRVEEIRGNAKGTTFAEISKGVFRSMEMVIPTEDLLQAFDQNVSPMMQMVHVIKKQTEVLKKSRDGLLPKLMSGELAV